MATIIMNVTREFLRTHPNYVFVFGDNLEHRGHGGAAVLRDEPNTYGFVTKRVPTNDNSAFFTPSAYLPTFVDEMRKLREEIYAHPDKIYLISRLGGGLANRYRIWEEVIRPSLRRQLESRFHDQVVFLFDDDQLTSQPEGQP